MRGLPNNISALGDTFIVSLDNGDLRKYEDMKKCSVLLESGNEVMDCEAADSGRWICTLKNGEVWTGYIDDAAQASSIG